MGQTEIGTPCEICGKAIGRGWLATHPYSHTCGRQCFMVKAFSEPLIASDGTVLHDPLPAAVMARFHLVTIGR